MKGALLVLLCASSAFASRLNEAGPAPVSAIVFTIIFGIVTALNLVWLIKVVKQKINFNHAVDVEKQTLVNSTLSEGVVASNINVSAKSRPSLLSEVRQDEHLAWAHETISPMRSTLVSCLSVSLFFNFSGFATAFSFMFVFDGRTDIIFLSLWIPLIFMVCMLLLISFVYVRSVANAVIYAVTSKRVFIFSAVRGGCCGGRVETVRAYDLDGIHQTTLTRKEDGSGTLTFSAAGVMDGAASSDRSVHGLGFAFVDIPNVTAVKNLIEQYKTLRKKQAGNQ
jgi:hypothetical protein